MAQIIKFFTSSADVVLDPAANVGSTMIGASLCGRQGVAIEEEKEYVYAFAKIQANYSTSCGSIVTIEQKGYYDKLLQNAKMHNESIRMLPEFKVGTVDFALTAPSSPVDCANTEDMKNYKKWWKTLSDELFRILESGRYFVFIIGDRFFNGEYYDLTSEITTLVRGAGFKFKGKRILIDKSKPLNSKAYGIGTNYVPNIEHENLIVMRKE